MPGPRVLYEIRHAALLAWRQFVPRFEDREVLTWRTMPQAIMYLAPFFFMAFLVRRQDTHLIRLLLLPTVVSATVWCTFRFKSEDARMAWYEWDRGLLALVVIAKSFDYACAQDGRRKVGENELPPVHEPHAEPHAVPADAIGDGTSKDENSDEDTDEDGGPPTEDRDAYPPVVSPRRSLRNPLIDAFEVAFAMRGVGWDFGRHVYVPRGPSALPAERSTFVKNTVRRLVRNQLLIDFVDTVEKMTPGVTASGGTIFLPQLPPLERYAVSTCLHLAHGLLIIAGVALVYDYLSLVGVFLFGQSPSAWPPIHGDLRQTRSLHQFWSRGWHQVLRYTFLTFGGFQGAGSLETSGWCSGHSLRRLCSMKSA
ncbi:hypothetical protein C8Q80DRAFT_706252 [Daedaleopsis nitida]|nr:hypothetical protein C8Q80DRAFT_706252 [Daedaleopsis nitida]